MMSSAQKQPANVDIFDAYFRRADLDCDGRISGAEAVAFFQGSALPKHVLAQIWAHADQRQSGFLGRAEFYNALKLVTVAQSKRELTPEIVKAALYGPAAAKIPPPQINLNLVPAPQANSSLVAPVTQNHTVTSALPQNFGGTSVSASLRPQSIHTQDKNLVRPPLPTSSSSSHLTHGVATQGHPRGPTSAGSRPPNSSLTSDWMGGASGRPPVATSSPAQNNVTSLSMGQDGIGLARSGPTTSLPPIPQPAFGMSPSGLQANNSKPQKVSGNGFSSGLDFGGDVFSVTPSQPKQDAPSPASSSTNVSASSAVASISDGIQPSVRPTALGSLQSSLMTQVSVGQFHSFGKQNQPVSPEIVATSSAPETVPIVESSSRQSEMLWPKMTQNSVQKYTKVFVEVDTDRDGKITGEQARNLFLSWRLPREVLKQVWDLSDQDNDSMLSLREFCLALYLMERYREGRPLSAAISSEIMIHLSSMIPSNINYSTIGNTAWRPSAGFPQQRGMPGPAAQLMTHAVSPRPPKPPTSVPVPQTDERPMNEKPKPKVPVLEKHLVDQLSTEEQSSLNSKFKEATEADKKVEELEKDIVESKQKIEFFRAKMQELILYKSRCDSRLNEIIERASADKREVESLAKKYEEKYKQSGDVASKLSIEEATFRDIQEKKMEFYKELVKIDQNGTAGGDFQVDAVRIQSDLDEIVKSLNHRCKKYGLRTKPTTLLEVPFGWQAGIQEGAVDWDEDWDKFEDEGFTFVKELIVNVQNLLAPPRQKMKLAKKEEPSPVESPTAVSSPSAIAKLDKLHRSDEGDVENGSAKSAPNSPLASSSIGSPSREFSNLGKNIGYDASPRDKDTQSDQWGTGSSFTGDKSFDEPAWGTFDNNDDIDSVWGFNAASSTKDVEHKRKNSDNDFGSDFSLNPIRVGSPQAGGISQSRPFRFDDSVPGTPLNNLSNSPRMSRMGSEPAFDSFSRFDSFSMHDGFSPNNTMARFDSMRSTKDFDPSHGFPSFDDSDLFGSSGPFRTSLDSQTPRNTSDRWNAF